VSDARKHALQNQIGKKFNARRRHEDGHAGMKGLKLI